MNDRKQSAKTSQERMRQEASEWVTRREDGLSESEERAFEQWLAEDPRREEYIRSLEQIWDVLPDLRMLLPDQGTGKIPDPDAFAPRTSFERGKQFDRRRMALIAAAGLAACFALFLSLDRIGWPSSEGLEESRYVAHWSASDFEGRLMPDGSFVELKAGSEAKIQFDTDSRRLELLKGEAHFSVAKDRLRPFIVMGGGRSFVAVGTAFNIRLDSESVELLVTEGVVRVEPTTNLNPVADERVVGEAENEVELVAMQRSILPIQSALDEAPMVEAVDEKVIDETLAWKRELFDFSATPLSEAVAKFNRYNRKQLILVGDQLGGIEIDGIYRSDNLDSFVRALELSPGLVAETIEDREIRLSRRN